MEYSVSLPLLKILIREDKYSLFFPFRSWKLNPFTSGRAFDARPDVIVRLSLPGAVFPADGTLLSEETEAFFSFEVHRLPEGSLLFTVRKNRSNHIYIQFVYNPAVAELTLTEDQTDTAGIAAIECLGRFLPAFVLQHGGLTLHGVLMEHKGQGIIISAPSGVGKTTHAHLWRDHKNAIILNGDLSSCYQKTSELGSKWTGFGHPWCGTSGEYMNREVPITAIVVLEQSENNEATRLEGFEAFKAVFPQLQLPAWDKNLSETGVDLLFEMLKEIPVLRLRCRPDVEAVETLEAALREL